MRCVNATSPIDISKNNITDDCKLKCKYQYDYPNSASSIMNLGLYLKLTYDNFPVPPVIYNNANMNVDEIRIFKPSLHRYNGIQAKGEIIIKHSGNGKNLLVCIPMKIMNDNSKGSKILDEIMEIAKDKIPNSPDCTTLNVQNFTLNDFIPTSPFYSYQGTLPYEPCNGMFNFVVYNLDSAFNVNPDTFAIIDKLISNQDYSIKKGVKYYYNVVGAQPKNSGDTDEYYLECNPTGSEGDVLYTKDLNSIDQSSGRGGVTLNTAGKVGDFFNPVKNPFISIIYGIILGYIIYKIIERYRS